MDEIATRAKGRLAMTNTNVKDGGIVGCIKRQELWVEMKDLKYKDVGCSGCDCHACWRQARNDRRERWV